VGIEQQIREILEADMPGAQVQIERDSETGKVGGRVIWEGFAGHASLRRQNRIFRLLRRHLSMAEAQNIDFIFTYTSNEFEQNRAA
jgi:acid stress-induced BolA-like protein IbaG/YrbA